MGVNVRPIVAQDGKDAALIFYDAVHRGTADVYGPEQRQAWAGIEPDVAAWSKRLIGVDGFAAEIDGQMVGFMTLDQAGYIDLAFVKSDAARRGVGRKLYEAVEKKALKGKIERLTTNASKKAKPFFESMGWHIESEHVVNRHNVSLTRYKVSKSLKARR